MRGAALAQAVTEGGNYLGAFLCTGTVASLRAKGTMAELNALLAEGVEKYAPSFRALRKVVKGAGAVEPALVRLEAIARAGVDFDSASAVAALRAAIRDVLSGVGFELPRHVGAGVVCELHGAACPSE